MEAVELKYNKYEAYKDSGVKWISQLPSHWEIVRSKRLFDQRKGKGEKGDIQLTSSQKHGIIPQQEFMELEGRKVTQVVFNNEILKKVRKNDFVISMRSFQGGLEYSNYTGCMSSAYIALAPIKNVVPEFYKYLFKSNSYIRALSSTSNLVRDGQAMRFDNFTQIDLYIVPEAEQTAIANFLDNKTTKIDTAIAQKEKMIELLKERKQIMIQNAVTKGLDENGKIRQKPKCLPAEGLPEGWKDSGVEWIGEIPEGWEVKKLKHTVQNIISGPFGSSLIKDEYVKSGFKIYGQEQVIPNDFTIGDYYITKQKFDKMQRYEIFKDDILISCVGTFGKIALVPEHHEKGIINPRLIKMTPKSDLIAPVFLQEILLSPYCFTQFELVSRGGTMGVINIELLSKLLLFVPPVDEQLNILKYLNIERVKIDKAIALQQTQIEKLKEYKAVLIDSAVTGKIKVS